MYIITLCETEGREMKLIFCDDFISDHNCIDFIFDYSGIDFAETTTDFFLFT